MLITITHKQKEYRLNDKMPFGKFKDYKIDFLPLPYVDWLLDNKVIKFTKRTEKLLYERIWEAICDGIDYPMSEYDLFD